MSYVLVVGLADLLSRWTKMPDAPPSEYSNWVVHKNRHQPFTPDEVARMRSTLAKIAPTTYADIFCEGRAVRAITAIARLQVTPCFIGDLYGCREQGRCAGDSRYRREDNPYSAFTAEHEFWDGGWCEYADELTER